MPEKVELLTPTEILDRHPHLADLWTVKDLGYMLRLRIVRGRKWKAMNGSVLNEADVLAVYDRVMSLKKYVGTREQVTWT